VAIFGCGGVGLSMVMVAKALGASPIIAVDVSQEARTKAHQLGATAIVDASGLSGTQVAEKVTAITGGGADLCVDAAGFAETCEAAVYATRRAGRMVQVGLPLGHTPAIPMARVAGREIEIIGSHGCAAADFPGILGLVERGVLRPERLVESEVDLATGAATIQSMDTSSPLGIVMITDLGPPCPPKSRV